MKNTRSSQLFSDAVLKVFHCRAPLSEGIRLISRERSPMWLTTSQSLKAGSLLWLTKNSDKTQHKRRRRQRRGILDRQTRVSNPVRGRGHMLSPCHRLVDEQVEAARNRRFESHISLSLTTLWLKPQFFADRKFRFPKDWSNSQLGRQNTYAISPPLLMLSAIYAHISCNNLNTFQSAPFQQIYSPQLVPSFSFGSHRPCVNGPIPNETQEQQQFGSHKCSTEDINNIQRPTSHPLIPRYQVPHTENQTRKAPASTDPTTSVKIANSSSKKGTVHHHQEIPGIKPQCQPLSAGTWRLRTRLPANNSTDGDEAAGIYVPVSNMNSGEGSRNAAADHSRQPLSGKKAARKKVDFCQDIFPTTLNIAKMDHVSCIRMLMKSYELSR
ncbi:uncharacterized protein CLUP02_13501 [Colletotrichum lupini]|uniref:Uncharacterized protein n=1 Tax=Colletotrichum lupini TaxID=145971 RepID=A0A9Q8WMD8_9PEZI|nr:uncharacterized protein CLUP02_13501 [Colletotrichum lupini]UQC87980.1 hypothetical protein CLUP02_13501 [Colletotrichum lupini]